MELKHFSQSKIYLTSREYIKLVIANELTLDEAIAEVRASNKIDQETKNALVRDMMSKWRDWCGYSKVSMSETILREELKQTEPAFETNQ